MTPHILARALYCNPDGSLNGPGTFLAGVFWVLLGLGVTIWVIRMIVSAGRQMTGRGR